MKRVINRCWGSAERQSVAHRIWILERSTGRSFSFPFADDAFPGVTALVLRSLEAGGKVARVVVRICRFAGVCCRACASGLIVRPKFSACAGGRPGRATRACSADRYREVQNKDAYEGETEGQQAERYQTRSRCEMPCCAEEAETTCCCAFI